jgi:hypothetical protein
VPGVSAWLDNAGKAISLIAGVVGAAYAVGGLVVTLRVVYHGFSLDDAVSVIGQLPREYVLTTGLVPLGIATVLGISLWLIAIYPVVEQLPGGQHGTGTSSVGKAPLGHGDAGQGSSAEQSRWGRVRASLPDEHGSWLVFGVDVGVSVLFAGATATLALAEYFALLPLVLVLPGVLVATMGLYASTLNNRPLLKGQRSTERMALSALVTVAMAIPGAILLVSLSGLNTARVCLVGTGEIDGRLLADTNDRVLLARSLPGHAKRIVAVPAAQVETVYVGQRSADDRCRADTPA